MARKYTPRWIPEEISSLAISSPPVISGNPGTTNRIAPIYAVSCASAGGYTNPSKRSDPILMDAAATTARAVTKNWFICRLPRRLRTNWPQPAPIKAANISTIPPPSRNVNDAQETAEASTCIAGLYSRWRYSMASSLSWTFRTVTLPAPTCMPAGQAVPASPLAAWLRPPPIISESGATAMLFSFGSPAMKFCDASAAL